MLEEIKPDIVSICTPNSYHKEYCLAALNMRANVFCEKPLVLNKKDAVELFDAADRAGRNLFVTQTLRYVVNYKAVSDLIREGILGDIYFSDIECIRRRGVPRWGMFHMKNENAGGCFCDIGVHLVDFIMSVSGNPKVVSVSGTAATKIVTQEKDVKFLLAESGAPMGLFTPREFNVKEFNVEEFASGYIRLENGMAVSFKISWALNLPNGERISIAGTKGGILMSSGEDKIKVLTTMGGYQMDCTPRIFDDPYKDISDFYPHIHIIESGLDYLDGKIKEFPIKREEVINVASIIEAFYKSAELNHVATRKLVKGGNRRNLSA
jgi:predicted dehydrogenase